MTPTPDLPVPDAALDARPDAVAFHVDGATTATGLVCPEDDDRRSGEDHVRAIAFPVVAAVLRAEADRLDRDAAATPWQDLDKKAVRAETLGEVARGLRARADQYERSNGVQEEES